MKINYILIVFLATFFGNIFAQINPVQNLQGVHGYQNMINYFNYYWDEPAQPHDVIIGYNVYRENELYRFQTDKSIYCDLVVYTLTCNGSEDFLYYNNGLGFTAHVTAVYEGNIESDYLETIAVTGLLLKNNEFEISNSNLYPNPTTGILNITNIDFDKINIYDIAGKLVTHFESTTKIDLSNLSKGLYFVKTISKNGTTINKVILE